MRDFSLGMKPLAYTSPYLWLFSAAMLFAYVPEFRIIARSRPQPGKSADRGSMAVILLAGWIGFPIAFFVAATPRFALTPRRLWFFIGIAVLLSGSMLRRYCWRALGRYFTGNVQVQDGQTVIMEGPYRYVRHPSYTGGMLMHFGNRASIDQLDERANVVRDQRLGISLPRASGRECTRHRLGRKL